MYHCESHITCSVTVWIEVIQRSIRGLQTKTEMSTFLFQMKKDIEEIESLTPSSISRWELLTTSWSHESPNDPSRRMPILYKVTSAFESCDP